MALSNLSLLDSFDVLRIRTNQLIVRGNQLEIDVGEAFGKANLANVLAFFAYEQANTARTQANTAFAGANDATTIAYQVYDASNTNIAGANSYLSSYVSDVANSANAFAAATIAGANTAVGAGANAYAATVGISANSYLLSVISGANSAVGTGANAFTTAANTHLKSIIVGANTAVGAGANAFASATIAGANQISIGAFAQANIARTHANAAFAKANNGLSNGNITLAGSLTTTGTISDPKGNVRKLAPFSQKTTHYALQPSDAGGIVYTNGYVFVDTGTGFSPGETCTIINYSPYISQIVQNAGTTLQGTYPLGTTGTKTIQSNSVSVLICIGTNRYQLMVTPAVVV